MSKTFRGLKKRVILDKRWKLEDRSVLLILQSVASHRTLRYWHIPSIRNPVPSLLCLRKDWKGRGWRYQVLLYKKEHVAQKKQTLNPKIHLKILANIKMKRSETSKRPQNVLVVCSGLKILLGDDCSLKHTIIYLKSWRSKTWHQQPWYDLEDSFFKLQVFPFFEGKDSCDSRSIV